jgi:PAS domain S-box-containing protein
MSFKAKVYVTTVTTVGMAILARGLSLWSPNDSLRFLCYLLLAVPASCLKVRLPGITGTMSMLFIFLLAGVAELTLAQTLIIGVASVLAQCWWHAKVRPSLVQLAFNVASISTAIGATWFVYHALFASAGFLSPPFRLAVAASVFFFANTLPVAAVIALTENKSLKEIWSHCYGWSFPYYLIGAAIVSVFSFANRMLDWQALVLIVPVVYVIYRCYQLYLDRFEAERKHATEVAGLHAQTKEALAEAIRANATLDAVVQTTPLAILTLDRKVRVTNWNTMAETIFGWSAREVIGYHLPFNDDKSAALEDIVTRSLFGELVSGKEVFQSRKDGSLFNAAIWSAPLRDGAGQISGVLVTVADVSDRRQLEDQLRLSQKMEAIGRLAGGVAHDFNNLLTVINGYSTMLVGELRDTPYAAGQVQEILNAGNRAADLVSQLLAFGRRQVITPKPLEINRVVLDMERMLRRVMGEHVTLDTVLDLNAGWIFADRNQIDGILLNLAVNARDAMPSGGRLTIETGCLHVAPGQPAPRPELPAGCYVHLVVRDTGQGMDFETQQHIFEPFFTTKEVGKGTGLGLSSVYGSVEQNRGRIYVASEIEKGTEFSIYFPRVESACVAVSSNSSHLSSPGGMGTILLVEDEFVLRRMLREALSKAGYRIWEAGNGANAMDLWGSKLEQIDLLVTDIVMPVMNGLQLAQELRKRRPDLRVVFMSGHSDDVIAAQPGPGPKLDLLSKPFLPEVLVRKVAEILRSATVAN